MKPPAGVVRPYLKRETATVGAVFVRPRAHTFSKENHMKIENMEQIEQLVKIFEKSSLLELRCQSGGPDGMEIYMSRKGEAVQPGVVTMMPAAIPVHTAEEEDLNSYISSPIVGTFYSSPSPEAKPFIGVGDRVKAGQTVCILEAMKLMTEIKAEFECEIETVLVSSGQKVEYGQPLFKVNKIRN